MLRSEPGLYNLCILFDEFGKKRIVLKSTPSDRGGREQRVSMFGVFESADQYQC